MKNLLLISVLLFSTFNSNAYASNDLENPLTVGLILNQIEKKAKNIIKQIENSANNVVNNAALNIFHSITLIEDNYSAMLSKTVDELVGIEKRIFDDFKLTTDDIFYKIENNILDELDPKIDQLGNFLLSLPFAKNVPLIALIRTNTIFNGKDLIATISLKGQLLNHKNNELLINGKSIKFTTPSDNLIQVRINSAELFPNELPCEQFARLNFKAHYNKGIFKKEYDKDYSFDVRGVQDLVGEIEVKFITETQKTDVKNREATVSGTLAAKPLKRAKGNAKFDVFPSKGYHLDIHSFKVKKINASEYCKSGTQSTWVDPKTASKSTIRIKTKANRKTSTNCYYSAVFQYKEKSTKPIKTSKEHIDKKPLYYSSPAIFELPKETKDFKYVKVSNCAGKEIKMIGTGVDENGFLKVEFDNTTKTLKVSVVE